VSSLLRYQCAKVQKNTSPPNDEPDFTPETLEEQIVCYADKFYSKSRPDRVLTVAEAAQSLEKFGHEGVLKFLEWSRMFE